MTHEETAQIIKVLQEIWLSLECIVGVLVVGGLLGFFKGRY